MPEISRFLGIVIAMFYDDHNPPHFHARYGSNKVEIDIRTLAVLAGHFPPKALGLVMEWASLHQHELMQDWELARQQAELKKIAPLE
jgi:phosphomannomutase